MIDKENAKYKVFKISSLNYVKHNRKFCKLLELYSKTQENYFHQLFSWLFIELIKLFNISKTRRSSSFRISILKLWLCCLSLQRLFFIVHSKCCMQFPIQHNKFNKFDSRDERIVYLVISLIRWYLESKPLAIPAKTGK